MLERFPPPIPRERRSPLIQAANDEQAIRRLRWFVIEGWHVLHPGRPLLWNWHHDLICQKLEAVSRGEIPRLVICIPPRCMKSELVSVFWHAWRWLESPWEQRLTIANSDDLSARDSRNTRKLLKSDWYKGLQRRVQSNQLMDKIKAAKENGVPITDTAGPPIWEFAKDQDEKRNFENTMGGKRECASVGSNIIGKGSDVLVIDDPIDAKKAVEGSPQQVAERMKSVIINYHEAWSSRVNDPNTTPIVLIMQRLHVDDLAAEMIREGAETIILSMEFDPKHEHNHPDDPRTEKGELLHEVRYSREYVDEVKNNPLKRNKWNAQFQQMPIPLTGNLFKRRYLERTYSGDPQRQRCDEVIISVDAAFKDKETSSNVVLLVVGRIGTLIRPLDRVKGKMDVVATIQALVRLAHKWPQARLKVIEDKANGPAIIRLMQGSLPGVVPFPEPGNREETRLAGSSKYARAQCTAVEMEAGNVELPEAQYAPWVSDFTEVHAAFPHGTEDDDVDAMSQAVIRFTLHESETAMDIAKRQAAAWA